MKMSKQTGLAAVVAAALSAMGAATAGADTIYTYTGPVFTSASSPWTTSDFVTVTLDFVNPLPSNLATLSSEIPSSFSFTDGIPADTITNPTSLVTSFFATDASGDITEWDIAAQNSTIGIGSEFCTSLACLIFLGGTNAYDYAVTVSGILADGTNTGGSPSDWVVTTTPLPAALPLFAGGLGAMGLLGWRRKRKNGAAIAA
jgi:hypothetical protein